MSQMLTPKRVVEMPITHNENAVLVATFDRQTPPSPSAYAAELAEYENSREFREFKSLMNNRHGVCG